MWVEWLDNPVTTAQTLTALLGLPVVLGLLLAFSYDIAVISGLMTMYLLVNYWAQWLCNDHFSRALQKTRQRPPGKINSSVPQAMECFWVNQPQLGRITTMMFFSSIAFNLALAGAFQTGRQKLLFQMSAYSVLILDVLIGEIVVARWRYRLDRDIEQARSHL